MPRAILLLLLPMTLLAVGCQQEDNRFGGLRREKVYQNIISLSPSTTELLLTNGSNQFVKGRTAACNYPLGTVNNIPVVAKVKPDYEQIAGIKPDLVVYDTSVYNQQDIDRIKQLGADTFEVNADTVDAFVEQLHRMGALLGQESLYASYVSRITGARTAALGDPLEPKPKAAVLLSGWGGAEHMIAGKDSFVADVTRAAGAEVVGPDSNKFEKMSPEYVLTSNPDVIVLGVSTADTASTDKQVQAILNDPRLRNLNAIRNRRIIAMDQDVLLRRGARTDRLIDRLHKSLGPQEDQS